MGFGTIGILFWSKFEMFRRPVQWWKNHTNCTIWALWPGICFVGVEGKVFTANFPHLLSTAVRELFKQSLVKLLTRSNP